MEADGQDRHRRLMRGAFRLFDGPDRVLKRGVVQLHHMLFFGTTCFKPTGQVDVDDVETTGTESQVERLHVHYHLVTFLAETDHGLISPGLPPLP